MQLPELKWVPSPNFSARTARVDLIVLHDTESTYSSAISWFSQRRSQVSAHYVLREDGKEATLCVRPEAKAWACCDYNSRSISLEMAGIAANGFADAEWQAAAEIVAFLCKKYGVPVQWAGKGATRPGICSHYDLGAKGGGHTDPTTDSTKMAWFVDQVNAITHVGGIPSSWDVAGAIQPRRKVGYGWRRDMPRLRSSMTLTKPSAGLASHYDLRPGFGPCYDQGQTSSCAGNASAAAFEFIRRAEGHEDWVPSRLFPYWCARAMEDDTEEDGGAQIHDAMASLVQYGCPPEASWPFDPNAVLMKPSTDAWTAAWQYRALTHEVVPQTIVGIKTALAAKVPVVFGFTVYESFESDQVAQNGLVALPRPGENVVGGHAVVAVGCDDSKKLLTVRNSWGTEWGDNGYFYMPYSYAFDPNLASDFQLLRKTTA